MKRPLVSALLLLTGVCVSRAQVARPNPPFDPDNAAPGLSATFAAKVRLPLFPSARDPFSPPVADSVRILSAAPFTAALAAESAPALPPAPSPTPRFLYGGRTDYRWQVDPSLVWFRFRSSVFNANAFGEKTSVTYFLNEWLGIEGSVTAAFGPEIYTQGGRAKFALYGGGPRIAWREKRWEPWIHSIFGGTHESPQTSAGSMRSYSIMAGGGADYRWNPRVSFRLESDYVLTAFFHQTQDNFLLASGIVFHF